MNKKINFSIGGLFEKHYFFKKFLDIYNENRSKFNENFSISSLFGCVKCQWNGGRIINDYWDINPEMIAKYMMDNYPEIECRLTFTNIFINNEDLKDKTGNNLLELFSYGNNGVIVYSKLLEDYIRDNYPNYKIISSITKCLTKEQTINELSKDYSLIVLNTNHIVDDDFLKKIPSKNKVEILVNDACQKICSKRLEHYKSYSLNQKNGTYTKMCNCESSGPLYELKNGRLFITNEKIKKYIEMGYTNFKIQGRTNYEYDLLETLVYYLVKPEYALEIREKFMLNEIC